MKKIHYWGISIIVLFLVIQLVPYEKPEVSFDNKNDLLKNNEVSTEVEDLLRISCYDCHSNETVMPWYSKVAPAKWLVYRDTHIGRKSLNFSDWEENKKLNKIALLGKIAEEVETGDMPMGIYTVIHRNAKLSEDDKQALIKWTETYGESLFN